jgi:galactokinase
MDALARAREEFRGYFGGEPEGVVFAPGRVNLIGEHVDYNDGLVLPMPVAQGTAVAWRRTDDDAIEIRAADMGESDRFPAANPGHPERVDWRSYCRGMVANSAHRPERGLQLTIAGDLARGAGLSSSASLCIAIGRALEEAAGAASDPTPLALTAQRTEHDYAGVACGIMDQLAIAVGRPGEATMIDCRDLSFRHIRLPQEWQVLVVDSGVRRELVDGEYNARRAQCAEAAAALGVASLRDATLPELEAAALPDVPARRARHVITEIARVREAVDAAAANDLEGFAALLTQGHASLRDLFEVSVPPVDRLVEEISQLVGKRGAARMTGAGFGGSIVVVADRDAAARVMDWGGERVLRLSS